MKCFVIMPFGNPSVDPDEAHRLDQIYSQWIQPTVEAVPVPGEAGAFLSCHRADRESRTGEIISHIVEHLVSAEIVIADLSGRNPNVFYELGVRHTVANGTILIADSIEDVPFDLRGLRAIQYKYDPEQMLRFAEELTAALRGIVSERGRIDNPVRRFLLDRAMEDIVNRAVPPGYDAVRSMVSEVGRLQEEFRQHREQITQMMKLVSSTLDTVQPMEKEDTERLASYQGMWRSSTGGTYCARLVAGRLYIPYCYAGNDELTAHYFNCRMVGDTLFGRFEWFDHPISGYAFYKLGSRGRAIGGWWYAEDVPGDVQWDISRIDDSLPGMVKSTWQRVNGNPTFPLWAETYFSRRMYEKVRPRRK